MILFLLAQLAMDAISILLTPIGFVNNIFGNILNDTGLIALIRLSAFFISPILITFAIDTLVMWFSFFLIRPLINFIRNKS